MFSRVRRRSRSEVYRAAPAASSTSSVQLPDQVMAQLHPPYVAEADVIGVFTRHLDPKRWEYDKKMSAFATV